MMSGPSRAVAAASPLEKRPPATRFRPDIEGLRAVAVVAVVGFHAGVPGMTGGFVGVDVFFVLSGFLITGLLWRENRETGHVRVARFYAARARRLLPAAVTVLVVTVVAARAVLPPLRIRTVLGDAIASGLYLGNVRLALQGTDYLADVATPSPFQHYWSLGVEEQFYLLWPVLLVVAAAIGRARTRRPAAEVVGPLLSLAGVTVASFAVSLAWTADNPPWAYFSLPSRAWELGVGGLVALGIPIWQRLPSVVAGAAGWAGLTAVVAGCGLLSGTTPFPGAAALVPVVGTALVIIGGCLAPRRGAGGLLALPPLRAVGRVSYSWYLWHWPVLVLAPAVLGHDLGLVARLTAAALSGALAVATLLLVENPLRRAPALRRSPRHGLLVGAGLTAAAVCVASVALLLAPTTMGRGAAAAAVTIGSRTPLRGRPADTSPDPRQARVHALIAEVQAAVAASAGVTAVPSNLAPPLSQVSADRALPFQDGCDRSFTASSQPPCVFGDPAGTSTVALVGDSHAAAWYPAVQPLAEQRHWRLDVLTKATCPFLEGLPIRSPYLGRRFTECEQWRNSVSARLRTERPSLVLLAMSRRYGADFGFVSYDAAWLAALTRTVATLRATGATVLVLGPVPDPHSWAPTCLSDHLDAASACAPRRAAAVNAPGVAAEAAATRVSGGRYADLTQLFCTAQVCPLIVGNDLVYRDDNHLTVEYAAALAPAIAAQIAEVMPAG